MAYFRCTEIQWVGMISCSITTFNYPMIFEVFHYLNDTMGNNKDNIQEVKKDKLDFNTKVCRDFLQASGLVFFILSNASYNL